MQIRFAVNQAEAFRQGVDCQKSIVTIDVDPSKLGQRERNLIADRLTGIDVRFLYLDTDCQVRKMVKFHATLVGLHLADQDGRLMAKLPTFESLMEAIEANQKELDALLATKHEKIEQGKRLEAEALRHIEEAGLK